MNCIFSLYCRHKVNTMALSWCLRRTDENGDIKYWEISSFYTVSAKELLSSLKQWVVVLICVSMSPFLFQYKVFGKKRVFHLGDLSACLHYFSECTFNYFASKWMHLHFAMHSDTKPHFRKIIYRRDTLEYISVDFPLK